MKRRRRLSVLIAAALGLSACGGVPVRELASHHVWERAICEASSDDERALVREGIDADLSLAISMTPVPERSIVALDPAGRESPLADRVLVRERVRTNRIPVHETRVEVELQVNGSRSAEAPVTLEELARRTSETLPRARYVTVRQRHVGRGETLVRIGVGLLTLGMSELLIRAAERPPGTYLEPPSPSEIAQSAPHAAALWGAAQEIAERDRLHVWRRPTPQDDLALDIRITHVGMDPEQEPCEMQERLRIELGRGPLEERIAARFGDREYTLAELRELSASAEQ